MRTFPIFVDVKERVPLVVGGTELAAIKARLIAKRAPIVEIAAESLGPAFDELRAAGKVRRVAPAPTVREIRGRPLVVSATEDYVEDARVSALARTLGVPVNVPDRPELCTFALAAIVDRGEVTIAIGTEGLAPVLATRLRAWLERELPPRLGTLARLAGAFRHRVADALPPGPGRRRLWERVFAGDVGAAALDGRVDEARRLLEAAIVDPATTAERPARVLLVGAGPGDPDLLTMRAVRALKEADVILCDDLVDRGVLDHARREAEIIDVGKRGGRPSWKQSEIHELILKHAVGGRTVVRLKGGDPFVFGRGGEEVAALRAHGIDVEVVPGITAAIAAAASTEIPLTHRDLSRTVTFMSGAAPGNGLPDFTHIDLEALNDGQHTLAVYMGVKNARALGQALLSAGWPSDIPVLAIENASRRNERRVRATVADLARRPEALALTCPALLLVGKVAGLPVRGELDQLSAEANEAEIVELAFARAGAGSGVSKHDNAGKEKDLAYA